MITSSRLRTIRQNGFLFAFCLFFLNATAQNNIETQHLLWTRYALKLKLKDNYQINQEVENRMYWFPWRQHQFLTRTILDRKFGKGWSAGVGFTYFIQTLPHNPEILDVSNQIELRPQFEIAFKQDFSKKIVLHHRYWNEFRIFEQSNRTYKYGNIRARYKIELRYMLMQNLTFKAYEEIHLNIGNRTQNVFDQNRLGVSLQYNPTKYLGLELGYFNWFQQRQSVIDFYNRHIIRLTVYQIVFKSFS